MSSALISSETDSSTITPPSIPETSPPGTFLLYVAKAGLGVVNSTPVGVNCGSDCHESYAAGTSVTLVAEASPGSVFKAWGGACSGAGPSCTVSMSSARNVSANFENASGSAGSITSIISGMPSNSWKSLDSTLMKDVCPTPYSSFACEAVISAWSGGDYDQKRDRMIIMGGGHNDSWYNNVFAFNLNSLQWQRLSEMPEGAGATAPPGWRDIRLETCGYYPKSGTINIPDDFMKGNYVDPDKCFIEPILSQLDFQQPRSTHTYGRVFVDRLADRYCFFASGTFPSAQSSTTAANCFDPLLGQWVRIADRPSSLGGRGQTAMDAKGNIWITTPSSGPIGQYDPLANAWSTYGYVNATAAGSIDIDRLRNHLYVLFPFEDGSYALRRFNLGSTAELNAKPPYSEIPTTGEAPKNLGTRPGFVYVDSKDQFYAWGGGRDLYSFDPKSSAWTRITATGDDPGLQSQWGTFGRFRYSNAHQVFVLVNSTKQNVFIYKP